MHAWFIAGVTFVALIKFMDLVDLAIPVDEPTLEVDE